VARFLMIAYTTYLHDSRVRRHAEAVAERGHEIDVMVMAAGEPRKLSGVNLIGLPVARYRGASHSSYMSVYARFFSRAAALAIRRSVKRPYDAVIVCTMPDAAVLSALPLRLFQSRILLDIHDTMPELYLDKFGDGRGGFGARLLMWEERISAALADHVLAVHEPHRRRLIDAGIPARKITVVANGPDPRIFGIERPPPAPGAKFQLVCHGTVAHRMGLDIAVRAIARLRDRLPDLEMLVIGDGDAYADVVALSNQLGLEDRIEFRGLIPTVDLPAAFTDATVGVVPQRATNATHLMLPVKLLEYAALGIPVIASRLRTIEHYFGPREVRFFEPGSVEALAEAIVEMHENPAHRLQMAAQAQAVGARLSWTTQREGFGRAIDSLIHKGEVRTWSLQRPS
jgi:glycosyltransferase involved in cell wall biosynthesis